MANLIPIFLRNLGVVATSPYAFVGYVAVVATYFILYLRNQNLKQFENEMKALPQKERANLIKQRYNVFPKDGLSEKGYIKKERHKYFFWAVMAVILLVFILSVIAIEISSDKFKSVTLTVVVHGRKGNQDGLPNIGWVILDGPLVSNVAANIDNNGQAFFQNQKIGDTIKLTIKSPKRYAAVPFDSNYLVPPEGKIYLLARLENSDKISGKVFFGDSPLPGVTVQIESDTLKSETDSLGSFMINIPETHRREKYTVWFQKKGYGSTSSPATPQYGHEITIIMKKL